MKYKKTIILLALVVFLLSIAGVSASEIGDTIASEDTGEIELSHEIESADNNLGTSEEQKVTQTGSEEKTGTMDDGTFEALNSKISSASFGDTVYLENNYSCEDSWTQDTGIYISTHNLVIDGNGYTIDAKGKTRIFCVKADNVTIKNIKFINAKYETSGGAIQLYESANGSVSGCSFVNCSAGHDGGAIAWDHSDYGSVSGCSFVNCSAGGGGAIYWYDSANGSVSGCSFVNCSAGGGGAIYWHYSANGIISDCVFINVNAHYGKAINSLESSVSLDRNWFGNTAENYKSSPTGYTEGVGYNNWLFLNATVNPESISTAQTADIIFKLYLYNYFTGITDYTPLAKVDLTLNSNGKLDKNVTGLDEKVTFTPASPGTGSVTATIGDVAYTTTLTVTDGTTFWDLNQTINGNTNDTITLDRNYAFNSTIDSDFTEGIFINREVTINGNGYTIDAKGKARVFRVTANNVLIKNITFNNARITISNGYGGAIAWAGDYGSISSCNFTNCTTNYYGGAIWWAISANSSVSDCNFIDNYARFGGGAIFWSGSANASVSRCNFIDNSANKGGSAIRLAGENGSLSDCNFINNSDNDSGDSDVDIACTIFWGNSNGSISRCSFINNSISYCVIYFRNMFSENNLTVNNNIFINNNCPAIVLNKSDNTSNADYNWFGNNATNYDAAPTTNVKINNWLFLNATDYPNSIPVFGSFNTAFKLFVYNNITKGISEYDNALLLPINLTITSTNGNVSKNIAKLGEPITFTPTSIGTGSITATIENIAYTIELNIKYNPNLSFESQEADYSNNTVITLDYNSTATGTVNITLKGKNGNNYTFTNLALNATIQLPEAINADEYEVNVTYSGDNTFSNATANGTLTVNKANSTLTINDVTFDYNTNGSTTISYTNATGVNASVVGQPNAIVVVNDTTITVSGLNAGNYTLTVTTITDANHNNITRNATITVNKSKTQLTANAITATYNINKDLVITLKDANGNALSGVNVIVDLNGAKTYTTDKNGQVKVSTKGLAPKAYTAKVTFNGNTNYDKSALDVKVTVKKATPKLTAKKKTFKTTTKTKKYTITLKDNTGKAIKKAKVTLKVKGKTYKATTNSKGKAVFKIKNLKKKGTFKATVTYKGNKYYNKVSKKANIKVIVTFKTVSKGSKDKSTVKEIQRALKDHGYYLSYKGHYLKVDGKFKSCTERSVKQFQKAKGLKVTGKVDEKTAVKLGII